MRLIQPYLVLPPGSLSDGSCLFWGWRESRGLGASATFISTPCLLKYPFTERLQGHAYLSRHSACTNETLALTPEVAAMLSPISHVGKPRHREGNDASQVTQLEAPML